MVAVVVLTRRPSLGFPAVGSTHCPFTPLLSLSCFPSLQRGQLGVEHHPLADGPQPLSYFSPCSLLLSLAASLASSSLVYSGSIRSSSPAAVLRSSRYTLAVSDRLPHIPHSSCERMALQKPLVAVVSLRPAPLSAPSLILLLSIEDQLQTGPPS